MRLNHFSTAIGVLLTLSAPVFAGGSAPPPGLEESIGSDERERMHRELDDYSNKAYPDRERVEERRQKMRGNMKQLDQNGDGLISREEAEQRMPGLARHFDDVDTDNDGTLSREEIEIAQTKMREMRDQYAKRAAELEAVVPPPKKTSKRKKPPPPPVEVEQENAETL
ncbi:MAG: hypothetical protein ACKVN9_02220 [Methylophilaceae bacterium]